MRPGPRTPLSLLALAALLIGCAPARPTTTDPRPTNRAVAPSPVHPAPLPTHFQTEGPIADALRTIASEARRKRRVREVAIALIDLNGGRAWGVNAHRVVRPASVIKLPVMVAAFDAASAMPPGAFDRLLPDIRQMITWSDNPATRRLVLRLGKRRVNDAMAALGLPGLTLGNRNTGRLVLVQSRATAAETALLLARLARREVVSPEASDAMLAILGDQKRRNRIPAGTLAAHSRAGHAPDDGLWIGNKTGTLAGLVHDAALVTEPRVGLNYTLVIYTMGARSESAGIQICATIAARAYALLLAASRNEGAERAAPPAAKKVGRDS